MTEEMYKELCKARLFDIEDRADEYMKGDEGVKLAEDQEITWEECWYGYFNDGRTDAKYVFRKRVD